MYNNKYDERTYKKFSDAMYHYAKRMFRKTGDASGVLAYRTTEHLRKPPVASICTPISAGEVWGGEWGNIWLRFNVKITPETAGRQIYVIPDCGAVEVLGFRDGKPTGIINSKNDFVGGGHSAYLVTAGANAGEKIAVSLECYAGHAFFGTDPYENYGRALTDRGNFDKIYTA